jgi:hypothetical protein
MESLSCFEVKSIVFPSKAGMHCIQTIFPSEKPASSPPSLSCFGSWCVALQYAATREEAAKKAASMFKAVGAKNFKKPAAVQNLLREE